PGSLHIPYKIAGLAASHTRQIGHGSISVQSYIYQESALRPIGPTPINALLDRQQIITPTNPSSPVEIC
ncbi:hypothetical protein, partial [Sedimenticola sp.]|uniref:hypothetical protein n=1 Tax=Sedimenticola sp. TaxID=1940285 RepID=UPI0025894BE5